MAVVVRERNEPLASVTVSHGEDLAFGDCHGGISRPELLSRPHKWWRAVPRIAEILIRRNGVPIRPPPTGPFARGQAPRIGDKNGYETTCEFPMMQHSLLLAREAEGK